MHQHVHSVLVAIIAIASASYLWNGTFFAGTITDNAVLQKGATARAAIYGIVVGLVTNATVITVTVTDRSSSDWRNTLEAYCGTATPESMSRGGASDVLRPGAAGPPAHLDPPHRAL